MRTFIPLLFLSSFSWGAIAFDAAANTQGGVQHPSWTHTVVSANNTAIIVSVGVRVTAGQSVSSATIDGSLMNVSTFTLNGTRRCEIWYSTGVTSGAHTMQVNYTANPTGGGTGSVSLTGVALAAPEATKTAIGTSATPTVAIATIADNAWVIDAMMGGVALDSSYTVGGSQTDQNNENLLSGFFSDQSTQGPKTPAGSVTMTGTFGGTNPTTSVWAECAISFAPFVSAGAANGYNKSMAIEKKDE